ncbi:RNA polymerase sigma factor [Ochrovirga pacifica]|uniref:RNA polymerase sigma factor n=1 Tax=Ochrovirga pacifica TaxID=1042376 RepID=UPI000255A84C|nr:RNA polymerase sigma factor [Ochrovirga pacifica]
MTKKQFIKELLPLNEKMYRLSYRLLNDVDLAKDIVQTVYCKLWEDKNKLKTILNKEAYVIRITKNACLDKIRLQKTQTEVQQHHKITEQYHESSEKVMLVKKVIATLPEKQRLVIQLRDVDGFSFDEISKALDLPQNTIRVSLSIARKKVREELKKIYSYGL